VEDDMERRPTASKDLRRPTASKTSVIRRFRLQTRLWNIREVFQEKTVSSSPLLTGSLGKAMI